MRKLYFLNTLVSAWLLSGCATTIPNTKVCTAAGSIASGAICAETLTPKTSDMTFEEYLDFLEPQPERPDPEHEGQMLPARSGAMCQSSEDWNKQKTALEQACRMLGKRCTPELKQAIRSVRNTVSSLASVRAGAISANHAKEVCSALSKGF